MKTLIVRLRLLEPLLATQSQIGEPNSGISLGYITGGMLRGAIVAAYLAQASQPLKPAELQQFQRLFLRGAVRFLHAYPEGTQPGSRMLPKPLSWYVEKENLDYPESPIADAAAAPLSLNQPKPPQGEFVWRSTEHAELGSLARQAAVHITGDDRNRKEEGASQVYRYEALAPGQVLVAAVLAQEAADLVCIAPALGRITKMGGSRTGGYGGVEVLSIRETNSWREYVPVDERVALRDDGSEKFASAQKVIVTLLSDAILRTKGGQTGAGLDVFLCEQAGLPVPMAAFQRLRLVGGFNRTAGLPLPQAWAVEAGSAVVYPRTPAVLAALTSLLDAGIGERTVEGFGRLAIDWQSEAQIEQLRWTPAQREWPALQLRGAGRELAEQMAQRQLDAHLQQSLVSQISRAMQTFHFLPSAAQLSRAQLAARRAYTAADLSIIDLHFANLKLAMEDWKEAKVYGMKLLDWIKLQTNLSEDQFLQQFGLAGGLPLVAGIPALLSEAMRARASAQLIENVLRQAAKQRKQAAVAANEERA